MPDVDAILDELLDALSAQSIICEPIEMDDKFIIPITKMGMDFGTNINMGQRGQYASHEGPAGCSAGGGVGFFPVAVVVVFKEISGPEGVKVVPLSPPGESASSIANIVSVG